MKFEIEKLTSRLKYVSYDIQIPGQQAQQQQQGAFSSMWRRDPLTLFPEGNISAGSLFLQHPMMTSV